MRPWWLVVLCCVAVGCGDQAPSAPDPGSVDEPTTQPPTYEWALTDVGLEVGVQDRLAHQKGVAAADFDGDGRLDLFVTNPGEEPILYRHDPDGVFVSQLDLPHTTADWGPTVFDHDADGDQDVFLFCGGRGAPCADKALRNDGVDPESGEIVFTDVTGPVGLDGVFRRSFGGALADYDLDGDLDIFVPVHWRQSWTLDPPGIKGDMLYRNNGDGTFTDVAKEAGVASNLPSCPAAWLDYDRDGDPDLYVPAFAFGNTLYRNEGDGTFTDVTPEAMVWPFMGYGAIAQDFDNDGWVDLLVAEIYQPYILEYFEIVGPPGDRLFLNDQGQGWIDASLSTGFLWEDAETEVAPRAGTMGFQAGDMDLDGYMEILFGNGSPRVDGGQTNRLVSAVPDPDGRVAWVERSELIDVPAKEDGADPPYPSYPYRTHGSVFFDYDGDDDVDLFVGNGGHPPAQEEPNQLFRNDSEPIHHWVRVRLQGAGQNVDGIGATVRLADAAGDEATWQVYRLVGGTSGFNATEPCDLQVGAGLHEGPHVVTVTWPGGTETVVEGVASGATLDVHQD